ncbi:MAG: hypothetical protein ABIH70_06165 [Chloroflexota bacterium]
MKTKHRLKRYSSMTFSMLVLLATLFFMEACESLAPIVIQNQTEQTLTITINDRRIGEVLPSSEIKNKLVTITASFKIEGENSAGEVIYSKKFQLEEMINMHYKVIISTPNSP